MWHIARGFPYDPKWKDRIRDRKTSGALTMLGLRGWHPLWRILAGAAGGAAMGCVLPYDLGQNAEEPGLVALFAGILAIVGAVAIGFLSSTVWARVAGGIVGAIATGLLAIVATFHLKGLIYSFFGAPFGALAVLLYRQGQSERGPAAGSTGEDEPPPRPSRWCLVGNIVALSRNDEGGKRIESGTKHFSPGTRVYRLPAGWGDGYQKIVAIVRHRGSKRSVRMVTG
jgi:hypothetical protein